MFNFKPGLTLLVRVFKTKVYYKYRQLSMCGKLYHDT